MKSEPGCTQASYLTYTFDDLPYVIYWLSCQSQVRLMPTKRLRLDHNMFGHKFSFEPRCNPRNTRLFRI